MLRTRARAFRRCFGWLNAGAVLAVAGCSDHYPVNPPLKTWDPHAGYRLSLLKDDTSADSILVVLMFSGRGTRAASLAYGTLEALRGRDHDRRSQAPTARRSRRDHRRFRGLSHRSVLRALSRPDIHRFRIAVPAPRRAG